MEIRSSLQYICLGLVLSFLPSCATKLTSEGEAVQLVYKAPADLRQNFSPIGILTCEHQKNLAEEETNKKNCEAELRNKAAEKGADLVVVESYDTFPGTATIGVSLITQIYKRQ